MNKRGPIPVRGAGFQPAGRRQARCLRYWMVWLALALIAFALARASAGASAPDPARALKEMADLEAQIEEAQRRQADEQRRLLEASRSLQSVDTNLQRKSGLDREGEQFLKDYEARARAGLEANERDQAAARAEVQASRSALALTGTRLAVESAGPASSDASLLALGLLHELHRGRARMAAQRLQDQETRRGELAGKAGRARESAAYQSVFAEYSLEQLRARHRALSHEVAAARDEAGRRLAEIGQLAGQREQLKKLIAKLAEQEAARVAVETPAPAVAAVTPLPSITPVPAMEHPALPANISENSAIRNPQSAIPEVPYEEGSEPMASAETDRDQTTGTRTLFWRARPVGVSALADGKVLYSGAFAGYRHLLIVDHGGGWRALYGNLVQCALKPDEPVRRGQRIGTYQADQGGRAEPLWFEVRQGAQAVAPQNWPALPPEWQAKILAKVE